MELFKIIKGDWQGWYGMAEKYSKDHQKVKLSITDMSSEKPFAIMWFGSDDVERVHQVKK